MSLTFLLHGARLAWHHNAATAEEGWDMPVRLGVTLLVGVLINLRARQAWKAMGSVRFHSIGNRAGVNREYMSADGGQTWFELVSTRGDDGRSIDTLVSQLGIHSKTVEMLLVRELRVTSRRDGVGAAFRAVAGAPVPADVAA